MSELLHNQLHLDTFTSLPSRLNIAVQPCSSLLIILGTRPEAIKLAPVISTLRSTDGFRVSVVATGQHRDMVQQVLTVFGIIPDIELGVMTEGQALPELTGRLLTGLDRIMSEHRPDVVLVQGDTTSAFIGALAAFYHRIPVAHVEAGLRTNNRYAPFPEELNRRMISQIADWHFAPTATAKHALLREGFQPETITVTGNTVVDALHFVLAHTDPPAIADNCGNRRLLVTVHRRESFGAALESVCRALLEIAEMHPELDICYPVHPNPNVRGTVERMLTGRPNIHLLPPLDYVSFIHLLSSSYLVLTDSGGIQEEAPALGKPVLVLREVTERPEAVEAGAVEVLGTDEDRIVNRVDRLLRDPDAYSKMALPVSPYGDGQASWRIVQFLSGRLREQGAELSLPDEISTGKGSCL